jgi:UDP-2-acetamido-3-amino-2,3-dideoxy-glucuronate N-acetyltransferase
LSSFDEDRQRVRVGVAGAGYWGGNLVRVFSEFGVLESICDPDEEAASRAKRLYPAVPITADFDLLLSRPIDAVAIATPAQLHEKMCLTAIGAGKHVFVEKPLALSAEAGQKIAEEAQKARRIVFVGHLLLYHPAVTKLLSIIEAGAIGRVWHFRSRRLSLGKLRNLESVWWSFAPHDVALMLTIMGSEPVAARAALSARRIGTPSDVAYADFEFSDNRSAHVEVCWLDPEKSAQLDIFGEDGVITFRDSRHESSLQLRRFSIVTGPRGPQVARGDEAQIPFERREPLVAEIQAFLDAVGSGKPFPSTAAQGAVVLRSLTMAAQSNNAAQLKALA